MTAKKASYTRRSSCWLQSHNAVVFSATNHDFRLPSRFVGGRADRGPDGVMTRRYAGRAGAPASGEERRDSRAVKGQAGIPVSVDLAMCRGGQVTHMDASDTHRWSRRDRTIEIRRKRKRRKANARKRSQMVTALSYRRDDILQAWNSLSRAFYTHRV